MLKDMPFLEHLEELRWHLIRALGVILAFFFVGLYFTKEIFEYIVFAPGRPDFITFRWLCQLGEAWHIPDVCIQDIPMKIQSRYLTGQFSMQITASFVVAFVFGFPYLIWEIWRFIRPGLRDMEQRVSKTFVFFSSLLFLIGVSFGYFLLSPMSIAFLAKYSISDMISNEFDITSYVSTVAVLVLGCGLLFQLPIAVYFLSRIGLLTPAFMRTYRRHAVVAVFVVGAIITPTTDPLTLTLISVPLYILYEVGILISAYVQRKRMQTETHD